MTGSIAVSQCGHTPNRPGHHGTVVASTVGTVAISCNVARTFRIFKIHFVIHKESANFLKESCWWLSD